MQKQLTPTQQLAGVILERPLAEYVSEKRTSRPKWSWQLIADQLALDTDGQINVSHESLRQWYGTEVAA